MTLRQHASSALLVLLFNCLGLIAVASWASALRQETLDLVVALDLRARVLSDADRCLHDLHREMTLRVQAAGGQAAALDPSARLRLSSALNACSDTLRSLGEAAPSETRAAEGQGISADGQRVVATWTAIAQALETDAIIAITQQVTVADPLAAQLLTQALPAARDAQAAQLRAARDSFVDASRRADNIIIAGLLATVAMLGLAVVLLLGRVLRGLRALSTATERYAGGDFGHRVALEGSDELAVVAQRVNEMALRLEAARDERERRAADLQATVDTLRAAQASLVRQEKMAALGDLVAGVAHEVNTPLGVAVTTTSLLVDNIDELNAHAEAGTVTKGSLRRSLGDARTMATLLTENLRRAATLIQSFKQVAVDRGSVATRETRLAEWAGALIQSLTPLTRRYRVRIEVDVEGDAAVVLAAGELEQVLTNLIVNACVHGYGEADGEANGDRPISVGLQLLPDTFELTVRDAGAGMSPEVAARVFEPFFTTRRGQGGTGLGMHIVHQLVAERFRGEIHFDSALGRGTCWTLRLPHPTNALRRQTPRTMS